MSVAMIFDLVMLAILVSVTMSYVHRGFAAGLVRFVGNLVSLLGAVFLSRQAAPFVFERFFENSFVERVEETLSLQSKLNVAEIVEMYAGFLPEGLKSSLTTSGEELLGHVGSAPELAVRLVQDVIAPLLTPVIAIVVFFLAFALCRMLVSFVVTVLTNLNRIPLLGGVNKMLGFVMGLLASSVDLYLILSGVWALIAITGGAIPFLNDTVLESSMAYRLFESINPFY